MIRPSIFSAYSDLCVLSNGNIAWFYVAGANSPYEGIVYIEVAMDEW